MVINGLIPITGLPVMLGAFVGMLSPSWLFSVSPTGGSLPHGD